MDRVWQFILNNLGKVRDLPWPGIVATLTTSFIIASLVSTFISHQLLPDPNQSTFSKLKQTFRVDKEKSSLNKAEVRSIIERNIFNKDGEVVDDITVVEEDNSSESKNDEIIKSTLPLKLIGTIYSSDPSAGLAVIEDTNSKNQNSFMTGDPITKNSSLFEVYKEKVIIVVDDHKEYIEIEKDYTFGRRVRKVKKSGKSKTPSTSLFKSTDEYKEEGFEREGQSIVMSSDFRTKLLTVDFAKVLQDAKAEPSYEGGELSGFQLNRIRPDSIYEKAGLIDGDVIREINGVSLVDPAQAIKLLNSLRGENEIDIRLVRGGQSVTINMQVR